MQIFDHLTQINSAVAFYRTTIIGILVICAAILVYMYVHTEKRISQATDVAYVLNADGDVAIASRIRAADMKQVEAVAHVRLFILLFFDVDKNTVEQRIETAYSLGNNCIFALKQRFEQDNWYTKMRQYNIIQSVSFKDVKCVSAEPLIVNADFTVNITSEVQPRPQEYLVNISFTIESTNERTIENPHAMAITNIDIKNFNLKS